jgi:hypothetical protein
MKITRIPDETDAQLRYHHNGRMATKNLKRLLMILGIKSAKPSGIIRSFAGLDIRVPGFYANVKNIGGM